MSNLNSINTNMGAMVALESLNSTNTQMNAAQKQISTGYRVADATDDGAAYAVAQRVRADVNALTTANQQLGGVQGLVQTTLSSLNNVQTLMSSMRDTLVELGNSSLSSTQRSQYQTQYTTYASQLKGFVQDANYNGKTLIGNITGSNGVFSSVTVVRNEVASTYGIATFSGSALYNKITLSALMTSTTSAASIAKLITNTGTFNTQYNNIGTALNNYGSAENYVTTQVTYNSDKINSLNSGLGSLVDADMAQKWHSCRPCRFASSSARNR